MGGGTKTQMYCQGNICQKCLLAVLQAIKLGLTDVGNQEKPLKYLGGGVVFCTNLEEIFKCMATILNTQLTMMQQRLTCTLPGCCCLKDKGNEILIRINVSPPLTTIAGLDLVGQWLGLPGHRTSHQWSYSYGATLKPCDLYDTN